MSRRIVANPGVHIRAGSINRKKLDLYKICTVQHIMSLFFFNFNTSDVDGQLKNSAVLKTRLHADSINDYILIRITFFSYFFRIHRLLQHLVIITPIQYLDQPVSRPTNWNNHEHKRCTYNLGLIHHLLCVINHTFKIEHCDVIQYSFWWTKNIGEVLKESVGTIKNSYKLIVLQSYFKNEIILFCITNARTKSLV